MTSPNGKRVINAYPRLGLLVTQAVVTEQPERKDKPPKEPTIPAFLRNWEGWQRNAR